VRRRDQPVICLMGPTASGKSAVALALAERLDVELVSVDSVMVYRGMDIGTAKPGAAERARVPHHLIDVRDPLQTYSAAEFAADAHRCVEAILDRGRIPLLVGGTMLYFAAFVEGLADLPPASAEVRARLEEEMSSRGPDALHAELARVDPDVARKVHPNDPQRLQRALEVYRLTGVPMSAWWAETGGAGARDCYRLIRFSLEPARDVVRAAVARRFGEMLEAGLIDEVKNLLDRGDLAPDLPAMRAVGYRQVIEYLTGRADFEEMQRRAVAATRQLAKRQFTWLRRWRDVQRIDPGATDAAAAILKNLRAVSIVAGPG